MDARAEVAGGCRSVIAIICDADEDVGVPAGSGNISFHFALDGSLRIQVEEDLLLGRKTHKPSATAQPEREVQAQRLYHQGCWNSKVTSAWPVV